MPPDQIPHEYADLWDELRGSALVQIENAAHWNMNSKRMETQARFGDILVPLGGTEGVLFLANLYHNAGKPIVPLNSPLKKALLTEFHSTAKHNMTKAVSPSSETMRTI